GTGHSLRPPTGVAAGQHGDAGGKAGHQGAETLGVDFGPGRHAGPPRYPNAFWSTMIDILSAQRRRAK
ncbi:hypothetical protein, partial [Nocardia seriolae]|uniref:hypothetical protein n=1 Tax=Nocardia seriolae TaxID=37332 RepID=UPI001E2AA581